MKAKTVEEAKAELSAISDLIEQANKRLLDFDYSEIDVSPLALDIFNSAYVDSHVAMLKAIYSISNLKNLFSLWTCTKSTI